MYIDLIKKIKSYIFKSILNKDKSNFGMQFFIMLKTNLFKQLNFEFSG